MQDVCLRRRRFLTVGTGLALSSLLLPVGANASTARPVNRQLRMKNLHTGEKCLVNYWEDGRYIDDGLSELNQVMRDHRSNEVAAIDTALYDQLVLLQHKLGVNNEIRITSGYRSLKTNNMLRGRSSGVAKQSYHTRAQAIDLSIEGVDLGKLRKAALSMKAGGVGYYPSSGFVHLDTGPFRTW